MKITVIGQIANKQTGLGKAINDFINFAENSNKHDIEKIDITNNKLFFLTLIKILFKPTDIFYFTPSGSKMGNLRDSFLLMAMLCKRQRIVAHFHNSNFGKMLESKKIQKILNQYLYRKIDTIILLGEKQKKMFDDFGLSEENFEIIPNGVEDFLFIDEEKLREKHKRKKLKIVYFSNMIKEKGYDFVLELSKKFESDENTEFIFSGKFFNPEFEAKFLEKIKETSNVIYYNGRYGDEKRKLLFDTNIFILPTQYPDETLPISMLEAIASGNYIFVTDVGVISEVVNIETTSFIKELDIDTVYHQIISIRDNLADRNYRISYFRDNYSNSIAQKRILNTIEETKEK